MKFRLVQLTIVAFMALSAASCRKDDPASVRKAVRDAAINMNAELVKIERIAIVCGAPEDVSDANCMDEISYHAAVGLSEKVTAEGLRRLIDEKMKGAAKPVEVVRIVRVSERDQLGQIEDSVDALIYVCMEDLRLVSHSIDTGGSHSVEYTCSYKGWLRKPTDGKPLDLSCGLSGKVKKGGCDKSMLPEDEQGTIYTIASWCGRDLLGYLASGVSMIGDAVSTD